MRLDKQDQPEYIGKQAAAIATWFSGSLTPVTLFDLTGATPQA